MEPLTKQPVQVAFSNFLIPIGWWLDLGRSVTFYAHTDAGKAKTKQDKYVLRRIRIARKTLFAPAHYMAICHRSGYPENAYLLFLEDGQWHVAELPFPPPEIGSILVYLKKQFTA